MTFEVLDSIDSMKSHTLNNYVIPGLESSLLSKGKVRLFTHDRAQQMSITPHSHRFDFACLVLSGTVKQRTWSIASSSNSLPRDKYFMSKHTNTGVGHYPEVQVMGEEEFVFVDTNFVANDWYTMRHDDIHSIYFGRNTRVLFFEGPQVTDVSIVLEPSVNGNRVATFQVLPWMFSKE